MRDSDNVPDLAGKDPNDLRMLYQAYSSQIEFSKGQVWRVGYYSILSLSAIVGLSRISPFQDHWKDTVFPILIILALLVTIFSTMYVHFSQRSMRNARRNLKLVYGHLSVKDTGIVKFSHNYETALYDCIFWLPLTGTIWIGFSFVFLYLLNQGGGDVFSHFFNLSFWQALISTLLGAFAGVLSAFLINRSISLRRMRTKRKDLLRLLRETLLKDQEIVKLLGKQLNDDLENSDSIFHPTYKIDILALEATLPSQYELIDNLDLRQKLETGGFCMTPPKGIFHGSYNLDRDEKWHFIGLF